MDMTPKYSLILAQIYLTCDSLLGKNDVYIDMMYDKAKCWMMWIYVRMEIPITFFCHIFPRVWETEREIERGNFMKFKSS